MCEVKTTYREISLISTVLCTEVMKINKLLIINLENGIL